MRLCCFGLAFLFFCGCQQSIKPAGTHDAVDKLPTDTNPSEIVPIDLNDDGKVDTITLSNTVDGGDPAAYNKVEIALAGGKRDSFKIECDDVDSVFLAHNENAVNTKHLFVHKDKGQFVIMLFGYIYGAGREDFGIISGAGNEMKMIYRHPFERPMSLSDSAGVITFLGRRTIPEAYEGVDSLGAGDITTYDPYSVYTLSKDTCMLDEAASRKYNEEHYVWQGPDMSEAIKVYQFHDGRKPVIVK